MAYTCPKCCHQFDTTLFEFGRKVRCDCGEVVDIRRGHILQTNAAPSGQKPEPRAPDLEPQG